jgi:glycosyltransferase involved in cell wall biosynthesis
MKIGLVIYGSLNTLSGGYVYDRKLVEHLRGAGDRVEIISLPRRSYPLTLLDNFSAGLIKTLQHGLWDVLLEDELNHSSLVWLNPRLRQRIHCPIVSIVHHLRSSEDEHPDWQNSLVHSLERQYLSSVDGFIYNSQTTRKTVEDLIGTGKPYLVATPGGDGAGSRLSEEDILQRAGKAGPLQILFVGNLIARKGLHTLIEALARLDTSLWHLTVIGREDVEPVYARAVLGQITDAGLAGHVTITGPLSGDDLAKRYAASHVLAVPSSYEGYGIVYIEAMGYGLPAIGSTAGAAGEIITHGLDGYLVRPGQSDSLASQLFLLSQERDRLARMSLAALARYWKHPTWQESMSSIRTFLQTVTRMDD